MIKGSQLSTGYINNIYNTIDAIGNSLEMNIEKMYDASNSLYNHASTIEDILTTNLSTFTNRLKSVAFSYKSDTVSFIESFESTEFLDKKFHVDKALTIDSLNKTLTLPEVETIKNKVVSVIVEPDSNGMEGNSLQSYKNADISVILDGNVSSLYEYERFASTFDSSFVSLVLTLKIENQAVTNGVYIKLFAADGIQFPLVESIQISPDGVNWYNVDYFLDTGNPKNDYYVRYLAATTRYVRVKLTQNVAQYVNTGFGVKQRYAIGVREIQVLTTSYDSNGDYISVPFSSGSRLSTISLDTDYKANGDIKFYVSANNGGRWLEIKPSTTLDLIANDTGVLFVENIRTVRLRIGMKRLVSPTLAEIEQVLKFNPGNTYFLKYLPVSLSAMIGGHISFGDIKTYLPVAPFPYNIKNELYNNSGLAMSYSASGVASWNNGNELTVNGTYTEFVDAVKRRIMSNSGNSYIITLKYVPYSEDLDNMLEVYVGGQKLQQWYDGDFGVKKPTYLFIQHENRYHTYLYIDMTNLGIFASINGDIFINGNISSGLGVRYKRFEYTLEENIANGQNIALPYKSLYSTAENFKIVSKQADTDVEIMLNNKTDFTLLSDRKTIHINDNVYSNKVSYNLSYYPAFDINELLPDNITTVSIDIPSISDADISSSVLLSYTYQDQKSIADIKYYSPICKKYKVTLS